MGKTEYQIKMDYSHAMAEADKLEKIAKKMDQLMQNNFKNCMTRINSDWKGEAATKYKNKGNKVISNVGTLSKDLKKTAQTVRKIAKNTYQAEKHALELAKKRTYH